MKRTALIPAALVLVLVAALTIVPSAYGQGFGLLGGLNFHELDDISATNARATYDGSTGYHVGVFYDLKIGPFALRPGVLYRQVGTYEFGDLPGVEAGEFDFDLNSIEVPVDLRWRVLPLPAIKPYVLAGPVLTFPWASDDFDDTKSLNLNADIGAGVEFRFPRSRITLMPELRYGIATSSFLKDEFAIGDLEVSPQDRPRLNSVMLRLHVGF